MIKNKSYMDRLKELKLLTLASRRKLLDLTFFFKCSHDQCDSNVLNYVDEVKSPYNLRNSEILNSDEVLLFPSNRCSMECFPFIYTTAKLD